MMPLLGWSGTPEGSLKSASPTLNFLALTPLDTLALECDVQTRITNEGRQAQGP